MAASMEPSPFPDGDADVDGPEAEEHGESERRVTGVGAADVLATLDEPVSTTIVREGRAWGAAGVEAV
jgi:hypothetical protein